MKKMHKGQKGLTLIELLIVVAILGIIAAVVIPNLGAFIGTGTLNAARTEAENVKTAALAYYADNNAVYPDYSTDLRGGAVDYLQSDPKGIYNFDTSTGLILADGTDQRDWSGITMSWNVTSQTWDRAG